MPKKCDPHTFAPLFRAPDPEARLALALQSRAGYRRCATCGRIETLHRYAHGGAQWRPVQPWFRERLLPRVEAWEAHLARLGR